MKSQRSAGRAPRPAETSRGLRPRRRRPGRAVSSHAIATFHGSTGAATSTPVGRVNRLFFRLVQSAVPTRIVRLDVVIHPADKAMARHAIEQSTWTIVDITDEPERVIFHLLDRRPQRVPNDRGDQAASQIAALLNSNGVDFIVITLDDRIPEPQALVRWRVKYTGQGVTTAPVGPSAIYTPEDAEIDAIEFLNDPTLTHHGEPVDIEEPTTKDKQGVPRWERAERWVLLALVVAAFGAGLYVAIKTTWRVDKIAQPQYKATLALWGAAAVAASTVVWHVVCRHRRVVKSEEWQAKHGGRRRPIRVIEAMLRVDVFQNKDQKLRWLRRSHFASMTCVLAVMMFFLPTALPAASGMAVAALTGVAAGLFLIAGAWQSWRQVAAPPRMALGVVGFGTLLASLNVLAHIITDTYFEAIGVPNGAINETYSTLVLVSAKPLGLTALVAGSSYLVWLLVYRNRVAEPQNWLIGIMFISATIGIAAATILNTSVDGAETIGSGKHAESSFYYATPVCVVPADETVKPAHNPLHISKGPKLLWKIGDYGTQIILLDPAQAMDRQKDAGKGQLLPAPVMYVTASSIVYTVAAGEKGPC